MSDRAVILGGSGFIGMHLARRIAQTMRPTDDLVLVDDFSRGKEDLEFGEFLAANPRVQFISADLTEQTAFEALTGPFSRVYLLAAIVGVRNAETMPERVLRTNTLIALNTLEWMVESRSERLFFAGTSEVYAGGVLSGMVSVPTSEAVPIIFDDLLNPRFSYAVSKLWGEAAMQYWGSQSGVKIVTGRFHNVYGPRMGTDHVIPELALRLLAGEDPLTVRSVDQTRAFCYVDDAVGAIISLLEADAAVGKTVHIGDDRAEVTIGEVVESVMRALGITRTIEALPPPAGSVHRRAPDISLLRQLTGYTPTTSLDEGVRSTVSWYREHRMRFASKYPGLAKGESA